MKTILDIIYSLKDKANWDRAYGSDYMCYGPFFVGDVAVAEFIERLKKGCDQARLIVSFYKEECIPDLEGDWKRDAYLVATRLPDGRYFVETFYGRDPDELHKTEKKEEYIVEVK